MLTTEDLDRMLTPKQREQAGQPLAIPTVHLNGDTKETLVKLHTAALVQVQGAMEALAHAAPNERNFYVQEGETFPVARAQHMRRLAALHVIEDELTDILLALG